MFRTGWLFALLIAVSIATSIATWAPARADNVTYPPGSRIGIVPPPGMHVSAGFPGFEDPDHNVAIRLTSLPPQAYADLEKSDSTEALKRQGATIEKRETLALPDGKAFLVIGRQEIEAPKAASGASSKSGPKLEPKLESKPGGTLASRIRIWLLVASTPDLTALVTVLVPDAAKEAYPDSAIRGALASLAVRAEVPVEEQLGLLPFKVADLAGFKVGAVLPGRALMLTDTAENAAAALSEPRITVSVIPVSTPEGGNRDELARQIFATISNLKDARVIGSQSLRIDGQPGHELMVTARAADTGAELRIVQWLRLGGGASLHLVGVAPTDAWTKSYPRFRRVRDGIEPR
jgi:hypothetical protein